MENSKHAVPDPVMRRLPRYYRYLNDLYMQEVERVSSDELAELMQITSSQVRQDLSFFGNFGQKGYGYNVHQLLITVGNILGIYSDNHLIVIGVGKLGHALLQSFPFSRLGFTVDAAFALSPKVVGSIICGIPVYSVNMLEDYVRSHHVHVAVLTLATSAAQDIVDRLIQQGVTGFWNFTSLDFSSKNPFIIFENIHLTDSLLRLNYRIMHAHQKGLQTDSKPQKSR